MNARRLHRALVHACAALALAGCAGPLAELAAPPAPSCAAVPDACFAAGRAQFEDYRRAKIETIRARGDRDRLPSAPVARLHAGRTAYAALLVHGLNDSAYYMADLADLFYAHGFNVVTVLLPGHGTRTTDMLEVSAEQWRAEVETGLALAAMLGDKLVVGGMSLGAALGIDAALRRPDIHGLVLFVPALELRHYDAVAGLSCAPGLRDEAVVTAIPENPVKYKLRVGNGVCQLRRLMAHNLAADEPRRDGAVTTEEKVRALGARLRVPTFVALTYADERVSPPAELAFAGSIAAPVVVVTAGVPEADDPPRLANGGRILPITADPLPHSYLVRRSNPYNGEANPHFDALARTLGGFLDEHFPARR